MDAPFSGSVFLGMSVDGFIARLDGDLSWLDGGSDGGAPDDGEGGDFGFGEFVAGIDALVMGRGTYEVIAPYAEWPYQGKPVHLLSTTFAADADPRLAGVHRSFDEAVAALSAAGYRRVYVDGGRTVHAFLRAGLIADLTLSRVPVLIGTGHTPFGELAADIPLEHVRTQTFGGGMVQTTYRVRPPG
jgi:dihydrofolate reductase